ncbi:uncharacterized protein DUF2784 [Paucimonas lemoignei]|uniref:Uncharacterized protein DUF2784 n=1 Tax=Paucimonas lemoignei TaxID=29443 RepID=A0A4R3I235_PAULE|nr:DUF2784 domain-containing protein [Paucimonas lemoignei]TCS39274.1 uncharacterized protein DUF2784 [Paucimonas lemoignei]
MPAETIYRLLADAVLILHFAIVAFLVGGLVMIMIGNLLGWSWVNRLWFRTGHLAAIGIVVLQSWAGIDCPFTTLEAWLRYKAGMPAYGETFIEHWLAAWLFYEAPWWTFVTAYSAFGLLVAIAWWRFPPRRATPGRKDTV